MTGEDLEAQWERIDEVPFESDRQYMATLHRSSDGARLEIFLKGSVERTLEQCGGQRDREGRPAPLDPDGVVEAASEAAGRGYRVLAMAGGSAPEGATEITHEMLASRLTFLGLQA